MDINDDRIDQILGQILKEQGHDLPPADFTRKVLSRLSPDVKTTEVKYAPLLPAWSWWMIMALAGIVLAGVLGGYLPNEMAVLNGLNMDISQIRVLLPSPKSLEISSPFVYGTLTLVFFVYLQLILLRHMRISRNLSV